MKSSLTLPLAKSTLPAALAEKLAETNYEVETTDSLDLLRANRFDIALKLYFLRNELRVPERASRIYESDIKFQTRGTFSEVGDPLKNSLEDFQRTFRQIHQDIKSGSFNWNLSPIPLAKDGTPLNGSHRVAAAILEGVEVSTMKTELEPLDCSYNSFRKLGMDSDLLTQGVLEFARWSEECHMLFLWPSAQSKSAYVYQNLREIVHAEEHTLTSRGARNLLSDLYYKSDWFIKQSVFSSPLEIKYRECFSSEGPITAILFREPDPSRIARLKKDVRELSGIEFASIHTTDTHLECIEAAELIFSKAGRHFVNYSDRDRFNSIHQLSEIRRLVAPRFVSSQDIVVDGGRVLSIYGLRRTVDIDFLGLREAESAFCRSDAEAAFHGLAVEEILENHELHFNWRGVPFISLEQVRNFKINRGESKDAHDLMLINNLLCAERTPFRVVLAVEFRWTLRKLFVRLANLVRGTVLEAPLRRILNNLRNSK